MRYRVTIKMGYEKVNFIFRNSIEAMEFSGKALENAEGNAEVTVTLLNEGEENED